MVAYCNKKDIVMEFQYLISKSEKMMEGDGFMVALWSFLNLGALIYLIYLLVTYIKKIK